MLDLLPVVQPEAAFKTPLFPGKYKDVMQKDWQEPLRIAFAKESPVGTAVSDEARQAVEKVITCLERQGHDVEETANGADGVQLMRNYFLMNSGEVAHVMAEIERAMGRPVTADDMEIETWVLNEAGKSVSAAEFSASLAAWDVAAAQMAELHDTYDFY